MEHRWGVAQGKQMVGRFPRAWAEQIEGGQHLPPQQKQNKPTGREQPRGWRPTERGGSFLKASSAHPPLPLLIGGFESCRPPSAAVPRIDCARLQQGRHGEVGEASFPLPLLF